MTANPDNSAVERDERVVAANSILVGGGGQPADPARATGLYREAMAAGSGAAAERLAVLAAMGVGRPASWAEALDRLAEAAELGWKPAQGQLAVLAGRDSGDWAGAIAPWRTLRKEIDMKVLLRPPPLRRIRESPAIALIDGLATPAMCGWLISKATTRLTPALVGDFATGRWVPDPMRTGLAAGFGLVDTDVVMVLTQERLARGSGLMVHQQEAPHVLSYDPGQEYKAHFDFMNPGVPAFQKQLAIMGQRVATCLTWLNEDYEGGETAFPKIDWKHRGRVGDAMLFLNVRTTDKQPDPMTLHAGLPVTRGRKWLLSQWVRDRVQAII